MKLLSGSKRATKSRIEVCFCLKHGPSGIHCGPTHDLTTLSSGCDFQSDGSPPKIFGVGLGAHIGPGLPLGKDSRQKAGMTDGEW